MLYCQFCQGISLRCFTVHFVKNSRPEVFCKKGVLLEISYTSEYVSVTTRILHILRCSFTAETSLENKKVRNKVTRTRAIFFVNER